jgi:hypothetical protein
VIAASATRVDLGSRVVSWLPLFVLYGATALFAWCVAAGPQLYDSGELAAGVNLDSAGEIRPLINLIR